MTITPTYQTLGGVGQEGQDIGNCMVASIATITGIELEDIPHFVADYMSAGIAFEDMGDMDWLAVLGEVMAWLNTRGYETTAVDRTENAGGRFVPHLAMVSSKQIVDRFVPHIIVTDERGIQVWDPQPLNTKAYQPSYIQAMLRVVPSERKALTPDHKLIDCMWCYGNNDMNAPREVIHRTPHATEAECVEYMNS